MNNFSRYPFPFYNNYYNRTRYYQNNNINLNKNEKIESNTNTRNILSSKSNLSSQNENVWLDIFGIKLYFDDVLILSLLFFLYKEEVKDEGLFLALVLLLIS